MFYFDKPFLTNKVWCKPVFPLYFAVHSFFWHKGLQKGKKCGCHHFIHRWGKSGGFGLTTWRWREIKIQATPKRLIAALCRSSWCATWYRVTRWLSDHSAFAGESIYWQTLLFQFCSLISPNILPAGSTCKLTNVKTETSFTHCLWK